MHHRIRRPRVAGCATAVLAAALLAACGGGGSSNSTSNAASTTTTGGGGGGARFAALRTCLAKNGITLPPRPARPAGAPGAAGGPRVGGGIFFGGGGAAGPAGGRGGFFGATLPAGVSPAQLQAALAKCGANFPGRGPRVLTPAQRATEQAGLTKFSACMKTDGIDLPAPNFAGTGPVFNTSKLNTTSPQFTAATKKCMSLLPPRFGRRRRAAAGG